MRVWVHIADVSALVRPGSALDRDAAERALSVYVPGAVEPMLPARAVARASAASSRTAIAIASRWRFPFDGSARGRRSRSSTAASSAAASA